MTDRTAAGTATGGRSMTGRIAVIGAGVMGTGIATLVTGWGLPVTLVDIDEPTLGCAPATTAARPDAASSSMEDDR
jgi:3-hydroxyacyl-CoA dehydrogenase